MRDADEGADEAPVVIAAPEQKECRCWCVAFEGDECHTGVAHLPEGGHV